MFYPIRLYLRNTRNITTWVVSMVLNFLSWTWIITRLGFLEGEQIFLHYNILFGVDLVGSWGQALFIPSLGIVIILLNAIVGWTLFQRDRFASYLLNGTALLCQVGILVVSGLLVFLNI